MLNEGLIVSFVLLGKGLLEITAGCLQRLVHLSQASGSPGFWELQKYFLY